MKVWTCDGCGLRSAWDRATWRWWYGVVSDKRHNARNVKQGLDVPAVACSSACEDSVLESLIRGDGKR